jgi:hypothetical protein
MKTTLQGFAWAAFAILVVWGAIWYGNFVVNQEERDELHQRFIGKCELLHGRVATLDEGETWLCISRDKVVLKEDS